jgi:DNA-binding transcriptional ArsR family regulator
MNKVNNIFSALADENRRRIMVMLSQESKSVNAIAEKFNISRPAISKHLRILERSKLVTQKKEGRERYYSFNPKPMKAVFDWLKFYDKFWDAKLNSLKLFVEGKHDTDNKKN